MNRSTSIYQDMAARTGGSIYIGVVGPVRTGKSTFIKRFMETQVLPHIDNTYRRDRAQDELPQSGSGRTIMTAEPKFVPEEAVCIRQEHFINLSKKIRLDNVEQIGTLRVIESFYHFRDYSTGQIKNNIIPGEHTGVVTMVCRTEQFFQLCLKLLRLRNCILKFVIQWEILIFANAKENNLVDKLLNNIIEDFKRLIPPAFSIKLIAQ